MLIVLCALVSYSQTNYYSKSIGNLELLANWGVNTDGSGAAPADFTTASQVFNIQNRTTATIGAAWTVSGVGSKIIVGDGVAACNFTIPAASAVTGTVDVAASATLTIINATVPTLGVLNATSTVVFARTTGGQSIPANTYNNITISNTSGTNTATGAVIINGTLITTNGGVFALGVNQLTGTLTSITHNGTITTTSTANPAIPTGKNWSGGTTGLITFANTTGGQFIPAGTYKTLTCSNTSGTNTALGNLAITGALTTSAAGGTLDMVTNTFTAGSIINTGTLATQNTSLTPLPSGITWGGIVNYNATTGAQTIMAGTYATLRLSNTSGTNTASGNLVVNTLLNVVNAGSILNMSTFTLSGTLTTITNNGTISTSNTSATPIAAAKTWGGTGTVTYALTTGGQTLVSGTFARLSFLNTSGTNIATGAATVNTSLTTTAGGTLNMSTFALGGTLTTITNNGTITTSNTGTPLTTGKSWGGQ